MVATLLIWIVRVIAFFYGRAATVFAPRDPIQDHEIQTYFFQTGKNFQKIMGDVVAIGKSIFGSSRIASFLRLNLVQYLFFLSALLYFAVTIPGVGPIASFVGRGLTINLDANERDYLNNHYHAWFESNLATSDHGMYVGGTLSQLTLFVTLLAVTLSAAGSASLLYNFGIVKRFAKANVGFISIHVRLAVGFLVSVACDLCAMLVLLAVIAMFGRVDGIQLEEMFQASIQENYLEYGFTVATGDSVRGTSMLGMGLRQDAPTFSELTMEVEKPKWPGLIFSDREYINDAGALCDLYGIRPTCDDRLRALFFRHLNITVEWLPNLLHFLSKGVTPLACGRNLWSGIPVGAGGSKALQLALPFLAALAALVLARAFLIPV
jgi:hypothetical protein